MKKFLVLLFLILSMNVVFAQPIVPDTSITNSLERQASEMGSLLLQKDFKTFLKYTYPKIIEMSGGEEKMIALLEQSINKMEAEGFKLTSFQIGKSSSFVFYNDELQCVVDEKLGLNVPNGKMTSNANLIGISRDNGKNWFFIDTHGADLKTLKKSLPNLSNDLVLPPPMPPVITEN